MSPFPTKVLLRIGSTGLPLLYLVFVWNRVWSGVNPPWQVTQVELEELKRFYPGRAEAAVKSNKAFVYSAFALPARVVLACYTGSLALVVLLVLNRHLRYRKSANHIRSSSLKRLVDIYWLESPLVTLRHHVPIPLPGLSRLTIQAPLRYEAFIIFAIITCNILPLCLFYRVVPGNRNVFWSDSHSRRDQLLRYISDRSAVLAVGQLPLVILMSGKKSPIACLCGLDMNQLMTFHRWLARMVWLQVNIHAFGYTVIALLKSHLVQNFHKAYWNWGVMAFAMFWALTVLSIREIRKRHYEVFIFLHIAMCLAGMVGLYLHIHLLQHHKLDIFERATLASVAFWAFDRFVRLCNRLHFSLFLHKKEKKLEATVTFLTNEIVRLRVLIPASRLILANQLPSQVAPTMFPRITAGQSIGLTIPTIQWAGDHPFTVLATGLLDLDGKVGYLDLAIKANQGLTRRLLGRLRNSPETPAITLNQCRNDTTFSAIIEGPYGDVHEEIHTFDSVLLFAGGVGITYVFPHFVRIALHSRATTCKLVWMIRDLDNFSIIEEQLSWVVQQLYVRHSSRAIRRQVPLIIEIHITRHETPLPTIPSSNQQSRGAHPQYSTFVPSSDSSENEEGPEAKPTSSNNIGRALEIVSELAPWVEVSIHGGRASKIVGHYFPVTDLTPEQSLSIVSCGPAALCDEVRSQAKAAMVQDCWKSVRYIEECFSW